MPVITETAGELDQKMVIDLAKHEAEKKRQEVIMKLIDELVRTREKRGISQKELAEMAGVQQSALTRLERKYATPQIDTLLRFLGPLGLTLAIVPAQESE